MKTNKKIEKIIRDLKSLDEESDVRFAFSYIKIGDNLNDLDADVIHNIKDDLASNTLINIIDEKIFESPVSKKNIGDVIEEQETMAKLHMFNLFNKNKKFEA